MKYAESMRSSLASYSSGIYKLSCVLRRLDGQGASIIFVIEGVVGAMFLQTVR